MKLLNLRKQKTKELREDGFTLLELIIVVVVLGLIVGIAIPIFSSQTKSGVEATLKSDIRNSAMVIMTEASKNQGRMPQWLPNYATKSPDNQVVVVTERSNQYAFCLMGTNAKLATVYYYSSVTGELSEQACPSVANGGVGGNPVSGGGGGGGAGLPTGSGTGLSWDEKKQVEAPGKRALLVGVVHADHPTTRNAIVRDQIAGSGHYETVTLITDSQFMAMSDAELNSYHTLFTYHNAWSTNESMIPRMTAFYEQGGKIMQDGNDNNVGRNPFITSSVQAYSGRLSYSPTKNTGLTPAFPYTFEASSYYDSDQGWRCITGVSGAVVIAETDSAVEGSVCALVYAGSNGNGGQWITHTRFQNLSAGVGKASIDWINS